MLIFAGIYYAITRRTITPLVWDVTARVVMVSISNGVVVLLSRWSESGAIDGLGLVVFFVLLGVNVFVGFLPVGIAIRRTQADARRRLADVS